MPRVPRSLRLRGAAFTLVAVLLAACGGGDASEPQPAASATVTATAVATAPTATSTPSATPISDAALEARLREEVLAHLAPVGDAPEAALAEIEVEVLPLPGLGLDSWLAVSSGFGIFDLDDGAASHILAIYERRGDGTIAEIAVHSLASEPTNAIPELLMDAPVSEQGIWIAVHGFTGPHSGTFELLWFDGTAITSELTGFSSSPGAAYVEDLDGDGTTEIVLDASDYYVYCYACGVVAWSEVLYRWDDRRPVEVPIEAVASDNQAARDLTEQAARYAEAGLWRRALEAAELAVEAAPGDEAVAWLLRAIELTARPRLEAAGSEPQPLMTHVIAGEYDAAAALVTALPPEVAFALDSPLIAGTVAEGFKAQTSELLIGYATAALGADPELASAHLVRAVGHALAETPDWSTALADIEAALALDPGNAFYAEAAGYLGRQAGD